MTQDSLRISIVSWITTIALVIFTVTRLVWTVKPSYTKNMISSGSLIYNKNYISKNITSYKKNYLYYGSCLSIFYFTEYVANIVLVEFESRSTGMNK